MLNHKYLRLKIKIAALCMFILCASVRGQFALESGVCNLEKADVSSLQAAINGSPRGDIVDFSARGESPYGESISVSQNGGIIDIGDSEIQFIPWKHIFWTERNMDVFFLANVTSTNFYIAFLYIASGSTGFEAKIFEYSSAAYQKISYQGTCVVTRNPSITRRTITQKISIKPLSKIENQLLATGQDLLVTGNEGYLKKNSSTFSLYTLRNTINPNLEWNELWTLLIADSNYYFSILYMNVKDNNKILLGHTVRLNDLQALEQNNLKAFWYMRSDSIKLTINTPKNVNFIWIDGFRLQRNDETALCIALNNGSHTIGVENSTKNNNNARLKFSHWSDGGTTNPLTVDIKSDTILGAEYYQEFLLTIESPYSEIRGGGWYHEGQTIQIFNPGSVEKGDVAYNFEGWSGDVKTDKNSARIVMDRPKIIRANWTRRFKVTLSTEGLPDGTKVTYTLNGRRAYSEVPKSIQDWVQEKKTLDLKVEWANTGKTNGQFFLKQWKNQQGVEVKSPILLLGPEKLTAVFTNQKQLTQLSCRVSTANLMSTGQLRIEGALIPPQETTVTIEYRMLGESWKILNKIETDKAGQYRYYWKPTLTGIIEVRSTWPGDAFNDPATSNSQGVALSQSTLRFRNLADRFGNTTSEVYDQLGTPKSYSDVLNSPFSIGMGVFESTQNSFANYGPLGSILGIIAGSAFIGFFYVFPWSTIILILKAFVTKMQVRGRWLMPLVSVWVFSFSYILLEEFTITKMFEPPVYLLTVFTSSLAITTGLLTGFLFSWIVTNSFAKRWWMDRATVSRVLTQTPRP